MRMMQTTPPRILRTSLAALGVLTALTLAGCRRTTDPGELMGQWRLRQMRVPGSGPVTTIPDPTRFTVEFAADGRLNVRADCNTCGGQWVLQEDDDLAVSQLACTLIACPGAPLDAQFLEILTDARQAEIEDGDLEITSSRGGELFLTR
jgi:heat shock protein HslJ